MNPWIIAGLLFVGLLIAKRGQASSLLPVLPSTDTSYQMGGFDDVDDSAPTGVVSSVEDWAAAIAHAEGFGIPNALPTRAHNPGDLKPPHWTGDTMGEGIAVFANDGEGWNALRRQLQLIVDGRSHVYTLDDSVREMGAKWAPADGDTWASNVVETLQARGYAVDEDSLLRDVVNG